MRSGLPGTWTGMSGKVSNNLDVTPEEFLKTTNLQKVSLTKRTT